MTNKMVISKNKKAYYEYDILDKYIAGIKLQGSEIKSIRNNKVSITEAYCFIDNGEVFVKGMYVGENKESGKISNHDPTRVRKLLMNKKEINKLDSSLAEKGLTLIPLSLILTNTSYFKLEVGLGKGKKNHDKRNSIKEKDIKRDLERNL